MDRDPAAPNSDEMELEITESRRFEQSLTVFMEHQQNLLFRRWGSDQTAWHHVIQFGEWHSDNRLEINSR